eukprot:TRINITY_DN24644_c0_g1_i1.p1 TRINITY_DN24644_c0_g1~~TRINITY_DN24644_c0_g1_i1.p1  ORF type:complete len:354 (-),score=68.39 TRINITY_DN24644_c0_g1_i1:2-976(-)
MVREFLRPAALRHLLRPLESNAGTYDGQFVQKPMVALQAGAGLCEREQENLVALMVEHLGGCENLILLAAEPVPEHMRLLQRDTAARLGEHNATCVGFLELALSSRSGVAPMYGFGSAQSLAPTGLKVDYRVEGDEDVHKAEPMTAPVIMRSLLEVLAERGLTSVDVLILDTEGHEWPILQGLLVSDAMDKPRLALRPGVIVLEYGVFWSATTRAAQQPRSLHVNATSTSVQAMAWPSLHGIVRWFEALGYQGYLLGRRWLLPLSGEYWHDVYEVCRAPHSPLYRGLRSLYNGWCWFDAVFVDVGTPLAAELRRSAVPWTLVRT